MTSDIERRARGALTGLAVGDALGMPTQSLDRDRIARLYGRLDGLVDAVAEQPIASGMPAGAITDDTEQALLVARLLIEGGGRVEPRTFADALIRWEGAMRSKGSLDLLGPSTTAAVSAIAAGQDPSNAGVGGTTNGAAMRVAPVAIAVPPDPPAELLAATYALSHVTHNSSIALAGAAAIAGAVSAGVDGADLDDALAYGLTSAERAAESGPWVAGASIAAKSRWALRSSSDLDEDALADFLVDVVGTSVLAQESVVTALVIAARYRDEPYDGLCFAARLGGDTDTVAAMAGAVLGAVRGPEVFGAETVRQVLAVSRLDLDPVIAGLLELRGKRAQPLDVRESYDN